jgi:hypothetical protein
MDEEVWIERGKGRTLSVTIRLFTDKIAEGGEGYVRPGHAWFKGDVSFKPNPAHGVKSIGADPIMFNRPEEVVSAILRAATAQGITILDTRHQGAAYLKPWVTLVLQAVHDVSPLPSGGCDAFHGTGRRRDAWRVAADRVGGVH